MAREKAKGFTDREMEILGILWESGASTVEEIRERLPGGPSASTVRTLLTLMAEKGMVTDDGKDYGKKFSASIDRAAGQRSVLRRVIDTVFAGSTEALVLRLMEEEAVDPDQLERLRDQVEQSKPRASATTVRELIERQRIRNRV
jgi:predicted transcriptional regulator